MTSFPTFSADYAEAREKFLAAARIAGAEMHRYDNPTKGLKDEALSCDAAWLGPKDASRVIVAISGTHGVEGFCGSGVQVDWLMRLGEQDRLARYAREAEQLALRHADDHRLAVIIGHLAHHHWTMGEQDLAMEYANRMLALAERLGDP